MSKDKTNSDASMDIKKYIEDLIKNPEYAINAIKMRNLKLNQLKSEIKHRIAAYDELQEKYLKVLTSKNSTEEEILQYASTVTQLDQEIEQLKNEKETLKTQVQNFAIVLNEIKTHIVDENKKSAWIEKVTKLSDSLPLKIGNIVKFILLPPVNKYVLLILFILFFLASFIGWNGIAKGIKPIVDLFYSSKSEGKK